LCFETRERFRVKDDGAGGWVTTGVDQVRLAEDTFHFYGISPFICCYHPEHAKHLPHSVFT
jgi:hypothetical protein